MEAEEAAVEMIGVVVGGKGGGRRGREMTVKRGG